MFTARYGLSSHINFQSTNWVPLISNYCSSTPHDFFWDWGKPQWTPELYHANSFTSSSHFGMKNQSECRTAPDQCVTAVSHFCNANIFRKLRVQSAVTDATAFWRPFDLRRPDVTSSPLSSAFCTFPAFSPARQMAVMWSCCTRLPGARRNTEEWEAG